MSANTRKWIEGLQERPFSYDPLTGIRTFFSSTPRGEWQFRHEFDDTYAEVEASKALAKNEDHWKKGVKNSMLHYAHIPDAILFKWHCEGVDIRDQRELLKMVNKPEWAYLRCTEKIHTEQG
jgi:hypothetical protein